MSLAESPVTFPAGSFRLEGYASVPAGATHAVVVCHPHPEYGGTMDDGIVTAVARSLGAAGIATLRFNFRGVGRSEGRHSGGGAEIDDVRAALDCLAERAPGARLALAGYSFGAAVAVRAAGVDRRAERVAAIALPAAMLDAEFLAECRTPLLLVHGDRDQFAPVAQLEAILARCPAPTEVERIPGADHFLYPATDRIGARIVRFVSGA
jgi:alpha/beta superfamily hydrolase